jgi:hypothetical protein
VLFPANGAALVGARMSPREVTRPPVFLRLAPGSRQRRLGGSLASSAIHVLGQPSIHYWLSAAFALARLDTVSTTRAGPLPWVVA